MPTQEERLSTLEKFQSLAATHIRETEENTAILLGVIREYGRDIKRTFQRLEIIDGRLDSLEGHLDTLEDRFGALENRFGTLESGFAALESGFASQEKKLDQILLLLTTQSTKPIQETE